MNTRIIVCIALFLAVASAFDLSRHASLLRKERAPGDTCAIYKCAKLGDACSITNAEAILCTGNSTCSGLTSGTCNAIPALKTLDTACSLGSECYSGRCINSKCNQGYEPGTPCTNSNQCEYFINTTYVTSCVSGRCAGIGAGAYCQSSSQCSPPLSCGPDSTCIQAQAAGSRCDSDENCVVATYCKAADSFSDPGTCTARIALGGVCEGSGECAGSSFCAPTNADGSQRKCVAAFSQAVGAFCDDSLQCGSGQNCSYSLNNVGKCQNVKSSYKSCDYTAAVSGCDATETCECNSNDGKGMCFNQGFGNPSSLKDAYNKAISCSEQCQRADTPCLADKCHNQLCKATQIYYKQYFEPLEKFTPSCLFESENSNDLTIFEGYGYKCSSASMVQVSAVVALLALVAMAL